MGLATAVTATGGVILEAVQVGFGYAYDDSDITKAARSQWKSQRALNEGALVKDFCVFRTSCGIIDLCNVRKIPRSANQRGERDGICMIVTSGAWSRV